MIRGNLARVAGDPRAGADFARFRRASSGKMRYAWRGMDPRGCRWAEATPRRFGRAGAVEGSLPEGSKGGVPLAEVSKADGRILRVGHGK